MKHDRQLLLFGAKRNAVLDLAEVQAYGGDSYGDVDYVRIFGLRPAEWYARGIRLLGRTAVECTRDELADRMSQDAAAVAVLAPGDSRPLLLDPFAGSGNTLYWLAGRLSATRSFGFERDPSVFALTQRNLALLGLPLEVLNIDYREGARSIVAGQAQLIVVFVAPPWGDALSPVTGLDLRQTHPPISEIAEYFLRQFRSNPILFVIQVHESVSQESISATTSTLAWSTLKIYDLNAQGHNHGILLATARWTPPTATAAAT